MRPWPMPSVIEEPVGLELARRVVAVERGAHRDRRGAIVTSGLRSLSAMPTPASVPPVPTAQMKPSTLPSVCSQISGPVRLDMGLRGWRRCRTGWPRSRRSARSRRAARRGGRRPSRSCWGSRRARPAPRRARRPASRSMSFFSWLWVSGMTMTVRKPSALPTSARPMPVLPAVPSTMMPPGRSAPARTASWMMNSAARSFTDWPGFMNSALPRIVQPVASEARRSLISGVLPIAAARSFLMSMGNRWEGAPLCGRARREARPALDGAPARRVVRESSNAARRGPGQAAEASQWSDGSGSWAVRSGSRSRSRRRSRRPRTGPVRSAFARSPSPTASARSRSRCSTRQGTTARPSRSSFPSSSTSPCCPARRRFRTARAVP